MDRHRHVDRINKRTIRKATEYYSNHRGLTAAEEAALQLVQDAANKPILDIGVGAGRTTSALTELSADYVGIDYVEEMVEQCQKSFPDRRFEHADARDLSRFDDGQFYLVMFSMNGLSMVDHAGRLAILREIYRLLQPGGAFLFSSYNKANRCHLSGFQYPEFDFTLHPLKLVMRTMLFVQSTLLRVHNRYRHRKHEFHSEHFSIVNDVCHDYSTMLYYTSITNQINQLRLVGFADVIEILDLAGNSIDDDSDHDSILYIARK